MSGLALLLIVPVGFPAHAQAAPEQQPSSNGSEASPLSAAECQVWTALGRGLFGWGPKPADDRQFVIFYRPFGDSYVEQCAWSQLGVTPPPVHKPNLGDIEFFGTPIFRDGGQTVVVDKTIRLNGAKAGAHGVFIRTDRCTLRKSNKVWLLEGCRMLLIT
jgi:hypothetical protein